MPVSGVTVPGLGLCDPVSLMYSPPRILLICHLLLFGAKGKHQLPSAVHFKLMELDDVGDFKIWIYVYVTSLLETKTYCT